MNDIQPGIFISSDFQKDPRVFTENVRVDIFNRAFPRVFFLFNQSGELYLQTASDTQEKATGNWTNHASYILLDSNNCACVYFKCRDILADAHALIARHHDPTINEMRLMADDMTADFNKLMASVGQEAPRLYL
jgi:hypothetical protein